MSERPPCLALRIQFSWKLWRVFRADGKGQFDRALTLLEEADKIRPLKAAGRVYRADLLLKAQRTQEAHVTFAAPRDEFKGSDDPNRRYLRHYCTYQLSWMANGLMRRSRRNLSIAARPSDVGFQWSARTTFTIGFSPAVNVRFG